MVEQIQAIGRDPRLVAETVRQACTQVNQRTAELETEEQRLGRELLGHQRDMQKLINQLDGTNASGIGMGLADIQDRLQTAERRLRELRDEQVRLKHELIDETEAAKALAAFDPVWKTLSLREQARLLQLLIERIDYDGRDGTISITFHPSGIKALADRDVTGDAA